MPPQFGTKIDSRDGKAYRTVLMPDGKWWSAGNLVWDGAGVYYSNNQLNGPIYGKLYSWHEAMAHCPSGAHLPTDAEWTALESAIPPPDGTRLKAISALWATNAGTDDYGFSALPGGFIASPNFYNAGLGGYWWTATEDDESNAGYRRMTGSQDFVSRYIGGPKADGLSVRFIVDSGNIPDPIIPQIYGTDFDGFERDASVRIERNIRWVDSVGGGVQGIPTMGASLDTWQISASLRVSQARAAAIEVAVGPYIGQVAPSLVLPHRMGENSFPGLVPSTISESGDIYVNPCIQGAGFRSNGRVAVVTDLFDYALDYDLTACPTGGAANYSTTTITTAPAWLAGKFAQHALTDTSNERRAIKADGYFNPLLYSAKHGRRFDYAIHLDLLSQAQADQLVAYFRGVRHEAYTVYLEFGTDGFASKAAHFRELSFQRNGIHWDGELQITLARS